MNIALTNYKSQNETTAAQENASKSGYSGPGERDRKRARASLRQAIARYSGLRRKENKHTSAELQATLQSKLDILKSNLDKLDEAVIRIATFGLVSRGKSAVLNALLGEKILQTGPINGVTQWPRSVRWTPTLPVTAEEPEERVGAIDLIDTPGLDEVAGQVRGDMARQVTREADLILFVVSGALTRTEYDALCELRKAQKPLILVFNKIDLYTEEERLEIYENLRSLCFDSKDIPPETNAEGEMSDFLREEVGSSANSPDLEIVMVAAEPAPVQVRVEWDNGKVTHEWETPPPQIEELRNKLVRIVSREGRSLLALNALVQARDAETTLASKSIKLRKAEAEDLILQYAASKALAVALNPVAVLDVLGATVADLALIRSLARLYNLPMTGYEAGKLWKTIMFSAGGMLLGEFGTGLLLGVGKFDFTNYAGVAVTQAGIAAYGAYTVGRAAQVYLEKGCTWGPLGQDRVIRDIVERVDPDTVIYRLRQEFEGGSDLSRS
ncbi:MAG: GTP-binding protein [Cyanobacteriota bacterium]|nr:GTP-binding protein [Cyanobacteriota bacterium]